MKLILVLSALIIVCGCSHPGWTYLEQKEYRKAEHAFHEMLTESPKQGAYLGLYKSYVGLAEIDSAEYYLYEGLRLYPNDGIISYSAGLHYLYVARNDSLGVAFMRKSQSLFGSGKISDQIEEEIQSALKRQPSIK